MAIWPNWRDTVTYSDNGPGVQTLHVSDELKVVLVGLNPGQALPTHTGPSALFHILDGSGVMTVGADDVDVAADAIVVVPTGAARGVRATTKLAFVASLGDPSAEHGPH